MNNDESKNIELDILRKLENTTRDLNDTLGKRTRSVLSRYPITFAILILFAVVAIDEGAKGLMELVGFSDHPGYLFLVGLIILIITGTVYKKLQDKE